MFFLPNMVRLTPPRHENNNKVEQQMSSVERVLEYADRASESDLDRVNTGTEDDDTRLARSLAALAVSQKEEEGEKGGKWPTRGVVKFDRVFMRYRENLEYALKDFSCEMRGRVGIVGRYVVALRSVSAHPPPH